MNRRHMLFTGLLLVLLGGCATQGPPTLGTEESFDGLRRVENARASAAWARPDIDWSVYRKVRLEGAGVQFRPVRRTGSSAREFPVTSAQQVSGSP